MPETSKKKRSRRPPVDSPSKPSKRLKEPVNPQSDQPLTPVNPHGESLSPVSFRRPKIDYMVDLDCISDSESSFSDYDISFSDSDANSDPVFENKSNSDHESVDPHAVRLAKYLEGPSPPQHLHPSLTVDLRRRDINEWAEYLQKEPYNKSKEDAESIANEIDLLSFNAVVLACPSTSVESLKIYTEALGKFWYEKTGVNCNGSWRRRSPSTSPEHHLRKGGRGNSDRSSDSKSSYSKSSNSESSNSDSKSVSEFETKSDSDHESVDPHAVRLAKYLEGPSPPQHLHPSLTVDLRRRDINEWAEYLQKEPYNKSKEDAESIANEIDLLSFNAVVLARPSTSVESLKIYAEALGKFWNEKIGVNCNGYWRRRSPKHHLRTGG